MSRRSRPSSENYDADPAKVPALIVGVVILVVFIVGAFLVIRGLA